MKFERKGLFGWFKSDTGESQAWSVTSPPDGTTADPVVAVEVKVNLSTRSIEVGSSYVRWALEVAAARALRDEIDAGITALESAGGVDITDQVEKEQAK